MEDLSSELKKLKVKDGLELDNKALPADEDELCCICRESSVHPVRLPCSHVFCYLCLKGVAVRSSYCALCRRRIPPGFLSKPSLVHKDEIKLKLDQQVESCEWYYEARSGGWWLYEKRLSKEIEKAFNEKKKICRLQISGFAYVIDFETCEQFREDIPSRRRKIKRGRIGEGDAKGIAGIAVDKGELERENSSDSRGSGHRSQLPPRDAESGRRT